MSSPSQYGELADSGQILEIEKPRRIVIRWLNHMRPELEAEGFARCVIEIEQVEGAVKLTVDHSIEVADSQLIQAVSGGWPKILSNLKSLLETGTVLTDAKSDLETANTAAKA